MCLFQPEANILLNCLRENYCNLQSLVGNAKVMGVIKANAYGHGALPISRVLSESGIYGFCVALSSEAEELICSGIQEPILHLGRIHKHNLELYNSGQVHCTLNSFDDLKILEQYYSGNKPIKIHLKIDTGMGRMGVRFEDSENIMKSISMSPNIIVEAVYSHFSTAEESDTEYRDWQLGRFKDVIKLANDNLPETEYFHIANSASILNCPSSHFNMVRPGLSLYGVSPLGIQHEILKPVMQMKATVIMIKRIRAGESVGYNRLYIPKKDENIAFLQAGYADGIPRVFSKHGSVVINGQECSITGNVSMDIVAVNCEDNNISVGDKAIFWGSNHNTNSLEDLSNKYDKIPYEFLTGVSSRVKRNLIEN